MIVKNESKIITRLLKSVLPIIDTYCICDTGSTDNTKEIITEFFNEHNIKGKIVEEPFKDFCYNRNFAMTEAIGMSDYLLLLDADMILQIGNNFNKESLVNIDTANIFQGTEDFYYQNLRICRNEGKCKYIGVTHEYIDVPNNYINRTEILRDKLFILDIGDGGSKSNKYERDILLLEKAIINEPKNERYYFYLANSYYDCGQCEKAIDIYLKRINLGGWFEEVWYSYYRIGICYMNLGKPFDAIGYWMEGFNYYPNRIENLYEIVKYYREKGNHKSAKVYYDLAKNILSNKLNIDNFLFLHKDVYTFKLEFEFTIIAAYLGIKNISSKVLLILNNSNDEHLNYNLLSNYKFYNNQLESIKKINLSKKIIYNIYDEDVIFTSSSSSIIPKKNKLGYYLNVRYVNYEITNNGSYLNCDKYIITINKCLELDNNFNIISSKIFDLEIDGRRYMGIEDIRIYNTDSDNDNDNNIKFIGTGYHKNNKIGIVIGNYNLNINKLEYNEFNQTIKETECEKNWVFFNSIKNKDNNELNVIYSWYPLTICKLDELNKNIIPIVTKDMPKMFKYLRGSSCGFNYKNEIWFITHIVSYESPRWYYHVIVVFDNDMNLLRYSPPFKLDNTPIEYSLSIIVEDDKVIIPYSKWDRETIIGIYDKNYIETLLVK